MPPADPSDEEALQPRGPLDVPSSILGVHHVNLPVSDLLRSRDWYCDAFGFEPVLDYEEEDRLVGVVLKLSAGDGVHLHAQPELAVALRGFTILSLSVQDKVALEGWASRFDELGVEHSPVLAGHMGWLLQVADPDGLWVQLHTVGQPTAD
jgi:catechol 2,3-dioxygenase-like lactoylglutathione lyase family enzyme